MDRIVNALILLFILVFDPLAICMVLAFNFLNHSKTNKSGAINPKEVDKLVEKEPLIQSESVTPNTEYPKTDIDEIRSPEEEKTKGNATGEIVDKRNKIQKLYTGAVTV